MLEELSEYYRPTDSNRRFFVRRMIHLDSDAEIGTSSIMQHLSHIDLAFNLCIDAKADVRHGANFSSW